MDEITKEFILMTIVCSLFGIATVLLINTV